MTLLVKNTQNLDLSILNYYSDCFSKLLIGLAQVPENKCLGYYVGHELMGYHIQYDIHVWMAPWHWI